ncbi:unnamed protein product [Durusdinium trenchii]|uniref:Calpain catalytic domain-containing protein n=1 Tax=Durusdinium trenchii TaxID=1381693 RepID=A0ABP0IK69_9DINO
MVCCLRVTSLFTCLAGSALLLFKDLSQFVKDDQLQMIEKEDQLKMFAKESKEDQLKILDLEGQVQGWAHTYSGIQVQHHNLHAENISNYNITCVPKVWLLLSGLYRSLKYVRPSMLNMLQRSAGDCWFVTLLVSSYDGIDLAILQDDYQFFQGRFSFVSVIRSGIAKPKGYAYAVHWHGCWWIAQQIREALKGKAAMDPSSTIVLRHRPDECFRHCFDVEAAAAAFTRWRYLILGQPISADNGLTTNWATYSNLIAPGLAANRSSNLFLSAMSASWSKSEYCNGMLDPGECDHGIPYCLMNKNTAPCRPPVLLSWQQHCLCRLQGKGSSETSLCIDRKPPDLPLDACMDITKGTKCILPRSGWQKLPQQLLPPAWQLKGGLKDSGNVAYMRPTSKKGYQTCKAGRDL